MVLKQWGLDFENEFYEHGGTRTPDPQNRNLMLYPTELHAQRRGVIKIRSNAETLLKLAYIQNT